MLPRAARKAQLAKMKTMADLIKVQEQERGYLLARLKQMDTSIYENCVKLYKMIADVKENR
jgi:hypothetical protein